MFSQTRNAGVLDDKVERFFKLITNIEKKEIAGTVQWWDCNFEEQEVRTSYFPPLPYPTPPHPPFN